MNGLNYVKVLLRSNAILNFENNDIYCFIWSILASVHPSNNNHRNRVSNYGQSFNEIYIDGFDYTNGFNCGDVHKFNEINNLSINIFELNFYQDHNNWRHELIPFEVSKNDSDRIIDLAIYKNIYALIKKLNVFSGEHHKTFI